MMHVTSGPARFLRSTMVWLSARSNIIMTRRSGEACVKAMHRMMFSVSSWTGSAHCMFGRIKAHSAPSTLTLSMSAGLSTEPWKMCTRSLNCSLPGLSLKRARACGTPVPLGSKKTTCKPSPSSAWSGWNISRMNSWAASADGLPNTTTYRWSVPGTYVAPPDECSSTSLLSLLTDTITKAIPLRTAATAKRRPSTVVGAMPR
mmetsp:Transcript_85314/g.260849  ORF Transcript_85314/g.260849 Transcript_85314/m.260849 type:complete len:203 (-) Transcript_85314:830-1438(-)